MREMHRGWSLTWIEGVGEGLLEERASELHLEEGEKVTWVIKGRMGRGNNPMSQRE